MRLDFLRAGGCWLFRFLQPSLTRVAASRFDFSNSSLKKLMPRVLPGIMSGECRLLILQHPVRLVASNHVTTPHAIIIMTGARLRRTVTSYCGVSPNSTNSPFEPHTESSQSVRGWMENPYQPAYGVPGLPNAVCRMYWIHSAVSPLVEAGARSPAQPERPGLTITFAK